MSYAITIIRSFLVTTKHRRQGSKNRRKLQHLPTTDRTPQTHRMRITRITTVVQHIHTLAMQHTITTNRVITNKALMDMEINGEVMAHPINEL